MQKKLRVLLVDDRAPVLLTYQLILQQHGFEVATALTYDEAVGQLDDCNFDLLVADLGLDGQRNGFDVIDYAQQKTPGIRSILLTGYACDDVQCEAEGRGVIVLFKPVSVPELLSTLNPEDVVAHQAIA